MKKLLIKYFVIISFGVILYSGCQDSSNLIFNPDDNSSKNDFNWISLPKQMITENGSIIFKEPDFFASAYIDGEKGGKLQINVKYKGGKSGGDILVTSILEFPKNAFSGNKLITMKINKDYGETTFQPHSIFNKPAVYNLTFEGLNLEGINPSNIAFVYQREDGTYEFIPTSKIEVNVQLGRIKVKDALLPHFSRYGFISRN